MKLKTGLLWVLLLSFTAALGTDFTSADREELLKELKRTRQALLVELDGLTHQQAFYQPAEDKWAAIHALEHIFLTEELLLGRIQQMVAEGETTEAVGDPSQVDQKVATFVVDRSSKFNAPEAIRPTGRWKTLEEGVAAFKKARANTIAFVKSTKANLRAHRSPNPVLGELDGFQWTLFLSGHSERHTKQIREIKESSGYPAG